MVVWSLFCSYGSQVFDWNIAIGAGKIYDIKFGFVHVGIGTGYYPLLTTFCKCNVY